MEPYPASSLRKSSSYVQGHAPHAFNHHVKPWHSFRFLSAHFTSSAQPRVQMSCKSPDRSASSIRTHDTGHSAVPTATVSVTTGMTLSSMGVWTAPLIT